METRGQSKQKWEQVNLRNFQRVKVQISGIAIPDIIPIPSHTYRVFNPNSRIKLSHISTSLDYFSMCQGLMPSSKAKLLFLSYYKIHSRGKKKDFGHSLCSYRVM